VTFPAQVIMNYRVYQGAGDGVTAGRTSVTLTGILPDTVRAQEKTGIPGDRDKGIIRTGA
jgi:hypothetical protein